ncbi:hypothetical protein A4E84_21565 [Streptomyces qaidamensis]|uniref:Uncharacterized protein n=1 Tax=Streptomyces qaidamensis TaxID=1783515 RepID=A0A143C344_9ACTN|nr:hypothetical protein A4E84_21565 [Streptomyces qaidamensis]
MGHRPDAAVVLSCRAGPGRAGSGRVGSGGMVEVAMAACLSFEVRREPVGKRVKAAIVLADDPGGDPAGLLL